MNCFKCNNTLVSKYAKKFCNSACAASFNVKGSQRNKIWCLETFGKHETKKNTPEISKYAPISKIAWGPFSKVQIKPCTACNNLFVSQKIKTTCSDECYLKIKRFNSKGIKRKTYNGLFFDSNWEVEMAKLLDKNDFAWEQPKKSIKWNDNKGKVRKYFPDFYLPDYDIYLDTKNPFVIEQQKEKLDKVELLIKLIYGSPKDIMARLIGLEPTSSFPVTLLSVRSGG